MNQVSIHPASEVKTEHVGSGTTIWQYCVVLPGARIGSNCNINAQVLIEGDVVIGDNVTVKSGVQLWNGLRVHDNVFIGPNATFANDPFPRSKQYPEKFLTTTLNEGASIGANATILPGLVIGRNAMVGAGAVVTRNVPDNAIVVGNPAVIVGYVGAREQDSLAVQASATSNKEARQLGVGESRLYTLPLIPDLRGSLSVVEYEKHLPFVPKRCFWIFDVPSREVRGEHAHKVCHQYLICVKGSVNVVLDDASNRTEVVLNQPNLGLHIPPGVWGIQYKYSADALLLVLASEPYEAEDYLRNYDQFCAYIKEQKPAP